MMKANYYILTTLFIITISCDVKKETPKETRVDILYQMKIPKSSKVIYQYTDFGEYAFSSWNSRRVILDSTVAFKVDSKTVIPFYITKFDLKSNRIEGIEFVDVNDNNTEKEITETLINGITCYIKKYRYKKGSDLGFFYKYRNFTETQDSLFFENLVVDGFGVNFPNIFGFIKGNITAETDSLGFVNEINIETFNEYPLWEMMSKNPMRIDFISGEKKFTEKTQTDLLPLSLVYQYKMSFKPDSLSKKQKISNYGIYKRIK